MLISDSDAIAQDQVGPKIGRYSLAPGAVAGKRGLTVFDVLFIGQMLLIGLNYSQSFQFVHGAKTVGLYVILIGNIAFAAFCLPKNLAATMYSVVSAALLIFYMALFSVHFDTKFTGALIASFPGLLAGGAIGLSLTKNGVERTLHLFFIACVLYAITFIVITLKLDPGALTSMHRSAGGLKEAGAVMLGHSNSTDAGDLQFRIKVAPGYMVFGMLYPLQKLREKFSLSYAAAFLFLALCIFKSDFRFMLASAGVAALAMFVPLQVTTKAKITLGFVLILLAGFAISAALSLNPFDLMRADTTSSGLTRAVEGKQALDIIQRFPFFGTGLISQSEDATAAYGGAFMAPSDIGTFGIMMQYGVLGLALAAVGNFLIYLFIKKMAEGRQVALGAQNVVLGAFVFAVLYEIISTMIFEGDATLIIGMAISYLALSRPKRPAWAWRKEAAALRERKTPAKPSRPFSTPVRQR